MGTAYPNAMTGAGCPLRDHDGNTATPDQASCLGYELVNDIDMSSGWVIIGATVASNVFWPSNYYTGRVVGNGFRVLNHRFDLSAQSGGNAGLFNGVGWTGRIEGLGVVNAKHVPGSQIAGGIAGRVEGEVIGSYVENSEIWHGGRSGGIAGTVGTDATQRFGMIAHSYVRATRVGDDVTVNNGGIAARWDEQRGAGNIHRSTCLNSYFSGDVDGNTPWHLVAAETQAGARATGCIGDNTTDANDGGESTTTAGNIGSVATHADMTSTLGYSGPYATWDDWKIDGTYAELGAMEPRVDVWYFGDETMLPSLKGWGHDRTDPPTRTQTGADTVNLCTRTLAVANEIIRLLQDDTYADGVTGPVPSEVMALSRCNSDSDVRSVSINNLRDFVATTAANPLDVRPDSPDPSAQHLTALEIGDFAYLPNAAHINLSGNSFETLPPRLFHGVGLRWLDLSDNLLATLPADLFAGVTAVTEVGGNSLLLNGNLLTDTGIPGRIFEELPHLNGLDLSDNALEKVNTRWFESLVNLGSKAAANPPYTHALGLHLEGNPLAEYYYSTNLFTGVVTNVVPYTSVNAADDLRTAIKAAITAAAGGTTPTTLDLDSTDYYVQTGPSPGYQPSGMVCPADATVAPSHGLYLNDVPPHCEIGPHWSPPHIVGAPAGIPASVEATASSDGIEVSFAHTASASFEAYQLRYRALARDRTQPWTGEWITIPVTVASGEKSATINDLTLGIGLEVQLRALSFAGPPSRPVELFLPPADSQPTGFELESDARGLSMSWDAPADFDVDAYEYRHRERGMKAWSSWMRVSHVGDVGARQTQTLFSNASGKTLEVELRWIRGSVTSLTATGSGRTRANIPMLDSIEPTAREAYVRRGDAIELSVDLYDAQGILNNEIATGVGDGMVQIEWNEVGTGGGSFGEPANVRRVTYTAPDLPGSYEITAEAGPDGICNGHHQGGPETTSEERAPCIATFRVLVSFVTVHGPLTDPINPAGLIPTTSTDDAGVQYTVFTPEEGGTFTGAGVSVTAEASVVPDRTWLGVNARVSDIPVPQTKPDDDATVHGRYYDVNGIATEGSAPLASYTLGGPLLVCMPLPEELQADLADNVLVSRRSDGNLGFLSSRIKLVDGVLTLCGSLSTLPATVAVAKVGTVPEPVATPTPTPPTDELPVTGGAAPAPVAVVAIMLVGLAALSTGIIRIGRMLPRDPPYPVYPVHPC